MKRLKRRWRRWKEWRKYSKDSRFKQILIFLGLKKSKWFNTFVAVIE